MTYRFEQFSPFNQRRAFRDSQTSSDTYTYSYVPSSNTEGNIFFPNANEQWPGENEHFVMDAAYIHLPWISHYDGSVYPFSQNRQEIEYRGEVYDTNYANDLHVYCLRHIPEEAYIIRSWIDYGQFKGVYHEKLWIPPQEIYNPMWAGADKTKLCVGLKEKWKNPPNAQHPNGVWRLGSETEYGYTLWYALDVGLKWKHEMPNKTLYMRQSWTY